jgi:hypothetical protein
MDCAMTTKKPTGKAIGGAARASKMTPEARKAASQKALEAKREMALLPKATHGSPDKPLIIGGAELVCYVLEDGTRLITQEGFLSALGRAKKAKGGQGASAETGVDKTPSFLSANNLKPFINNELIESTTPVIFRTPSGSKAFGYKAELLPKVCNIYLQLRDSEKDLASQKNMIKSADILMRGLAEVGIIALVDEATGYQKDRAKDALARILETFVAKELQPYMKTFPADYYEQLFRLRGLPYPPEVASFRPQYFGKLTNDIIYKRIAPGLLLELKKQNDKDEKKGKLFQRLTLDAGYQKLRDHISGTVMAMKLSSDYPDFIEKMNKFYPRYGDTLQLDLDAADQG